jgi:plastocyanin
VRKYQYKKITKGEYAMNKVKLLLIVTGVAFISTMVIFLGNSGTIGAAEKCDIVTIRGRDNIEPNMLTIKKGDCVVWMNWAREEDVILRFKEGEKCLRTTKAPTGFKMDIPSGCYIGGWLSYGGTASLVFTEPGIYNYEVEFKVGGKNKGTIVVK